MELTQKRYQVFISSTYIDLIEERKEVLMALLELNCIPVGMELFPAADEDQWSYIKKVIDESDYYLVIIGARYGSTDDDGLSFTEKEYDYAIQKGIPVIGFIHSQPESLSADKYELDPDKRKSLLSFKEKVQKKLCKKWTTHEELGSVVSRSMINLMTSKPAIGYVRGNLAGDPQMLFQLKEEIEKLQKENNTLKFGKPEGIEDLSQDDDELIIRYNAGHSYSMGSEVYKIKVTWNKILSIVGPAMFDEEKQPRIKSKIEIFIKENDKKQEADRKIIQEDFDTIISQLFGLGLICKSTKKHTASDSGIYWSLTPYGERKVVQLKAIKKT